MSAIEYLHANWRIVRSTPLAFGVFGALMFSAGFGTNEFINNKTETYLRDRLDMTREVKGSLSTLPNHELTQKTLTLVAALRELVALEDEKQKAIRQHYEEKTKHLGPDYSELDEPTLQAAWNEMTAAYTASSEQTARRYEERYKADAVLLREEFITRLPEEIVQREDILQGTKAYNYYHFGNSGLITDIALDLEKLAKLLPTP
jgi:hypothetical protein